MEEYKDRYPEWFDEDGNYIGGSKENRIERIKDSLRDAANAEIYATHSDIDVVSLKNELAELLGKPLSYEDRVNARIRERYTINQELAIQRQRDSKPEKFTEYNSFVEKIKAEEKGKL